MGSAKAPGMGIVERTFSGLHALPGEAAPAPFELSCRVVRSVGGQESMHIQGWVTLQGQRCSVSILGACLPRQPLLGREEAVALAAVAERCTALAQGPGHCPGQPLLGRSPCPGRAAASASGAAAVMRAGRYIAPDDRVRSPPDPAAAGA